MSKISWWPRPHNQGLNYIRLKYVFDTKEAMVNSTTPLLQEVLGNNYDLIISIYGNLFVVADNKLKAQSLWKMGTMKFAGAYNIKKAFNNLSLDELITATTNNNSKQSSTSQNTTQNDQFLYNDQLEAEEDNKYHSEGAKNSSNGSFDRQGVGNSTIKDYNIDKIKAIIEIASTAESELISNMINWIAATVQPDITKWGVEVETGV